MDLELVWILSEAKTGYDLHVGFSGVYWFRKSYIMKRKVLQEGLDWIY